MVKIDFTSLTKLYYNIGEVADLFQVNPSLIRFWEKEFTVLSPKKNQTGKRNFTVKDIQIIEKIYSLVKIQGYTLEGAKNELKKKNTTYPANNSEDLLKVIEKLESIKKKLQNLL